MRGVLGSPKALLLTGIGPSAHLEAVGVHPLVDLAGVGENLHDHPLVSNLYEAAGPLPAGRTTCWRRRCMPVAPTAKAPHPICSHC